MADDDEHERQLAEGGQALGRLLDASHEAAPDQLASLISSVARQLGAQEATLYLADVDQRQLVHAPVPGGEEKDPLAIDGTVAGRAYQTSSPDGIAADGGVWLAVRNGTDRLGVLRLDVPHLDDATATFARHLASLVADQIVAKEKYSDYFARIRRQRPVGLAAEMQLQVLPPLTFTTTKVTVAGVLEPAYEVAGDSFDYALNGDVLSVAVFDGVGHDLRSSIMATAAVGAYRSARRRDLDLAATATEIDDVLRSQFPIPSFVTAVLVQLDVSTGVMRWLNAGHPRPLLLRAGKVVRTLECPPRPPLGIPGRDPEIATDQLEPGDAILLFTDGIVEARTAQGEEFGLERLADFLAAADATGLPPPEIMRRLVHAVADHHGGRLQDDATCVHVRWRQ